MITLLSSYALRPESDRETFVEWARAVDLPATRARPGVQRFEIYMVKSDNSESRQEVVELFELDSEEAFANLGSEGSTSPSAKDWERFADPESVRNVFCTRID